MVRWKSPHAKTNNGHDLDEFLARGQNLGINAYLHSPQPSVWQVPLSILFRNADSSSFPHSPVGESRPRFVEDYRLSEPIEMLS
jgi:hypothetical protein